MATRAQLSQERSRLRRDELLGAAIELFAEGGSRAITHRAVAARAGLPSATTTYYFESIEELIREALGAHVEQWTKDLEALAAIDVTTPVTVDDAEGLVSAVFAARGPEVAALELSIFLAAARVPELRDTARLAMEALEAFVAKLLAAAGVGDPGDVPAAVVALVGGTALRRQSGQHSEATEARLLTGAIRALLAAHVLGTDVVDRAIAQRQEEQA